MKNKDVDITVILASASPRRIELIRKITDDFKVVPSSADEAVDNNTAAQDIPVILSERKASDVAKSWPNAVVIGCDTVVIAEGEVLGKPKDKNEARRMISLLSGRSHQVITGVTVIHNKKTISFSETTEVQFFPISEKDIEDYISCSEPYDKAGGYAVQGIAGKFVKELVGDYYNVVGFPVNKIRKVLRDIGIDVKNEDFPGKEK